MTRLRLALLFFAGALALGTAVVEHRVLRPQHAALAALHAEHLKLETQTRAARHALAVTAREHRDLEARHAAQRAELAAAEAASQLKLWSGRIALLKRLLDELPGEFIPEVRLLTPTDWVELARTRELDTPEQIRTALAIARAKARRHMAEYLQEALRRFAATSQDQLPADIRHLAPYLKPPADLEMLQRYTLLRAGKISDTDDHFIRELPTHDLVLSVGATTWHIKNNSEWRAPNSEKESTTVARATTAVQAAIENLLPDPSALAPLLNIAAFQEMAEEFEPRMEAILGHDVGIAIKAAVKRHIAERNGAAPESMADLVPYFPKLMEIATAARPVLAQLDYMRDHRGERPTDPSQLRRYLEKPLDQLGFLRDLKLTIKGDSVSMSYNVSTDSTVTVKP